MWCSEVSTSPGLRLASSAIHRRLLVRFHCPRVPPCSCSPQRSRKLGGLLPGQGSCSTGAPIPGLPYVDANGISQVFRRSVLCLCSVPGPRSNRCALATCGHIGAAPAALTAKASAMADFGANTQLRHLLPYASRVALPHTCKARFRLVGWPLPGGRRTLWTTARAFSSCRSSSSPALLTQQRFAGPLIFTRAGRPAF